MLSFSLLFTDGLFTPQRLGDPRAADVLHAATDRASDRVRTSDLLHAAVAAGDPALLPVLARTLPEGVAERHLLAGIEIYNPGRSPDDDGPAFDGRRERFDGAALAALRAFDAEFASLAAADPGRARHWSLELLVAAVLENLDADDREYLGAVLDPGATAAVLRERVRVAGGRPRRCWRRGRGGCGRRSSPRTAGRCWSRPPRGPPSSATTGSCRRTCCWRCSARPRGPPSTWSGCRCRRRWARCGSPRSWRRRSGCWTGAVPAPGRPRRWTAPGSAARRSTCWPRRGATRGGAARTASAPTTCSARCWRTRPSGCAPSSPPRRSPWTWTCCATTWNGGCATPGRHTRPPSGSRPGCRRRRT
ncbi:hypothetical protein ACFQU9_26410 [Actinomadura namibiensis]|uniref:hypothetical protein n=1 Tax=Actinomadura kijaniata TaxID=46161 RepID=UPI0036110E0F